jgi:hypothetical protein
MPWNFFKMKAAGEIQDIWKQNVSKLKAYFKEHGNYDIPYHWKKDKQLSAWVENIRKQPKRLSSKQYSELRSLGFDFNFHSDWNTMLQRLEDFYENHGHIVIPQGQKKFDDLFDWVINQRKAKAILTPSQISNLDKLNFEWDFLTHKQLIWEQRYQELVDFKKKYGHVKVPQDFKENKVLGRWVSSQRRHKTAKLLSKERIARLNKIGFLWKEDIARILDDRWIKRYNQLVQFKKVNGHIDRFAVKRENYQLGLWIETQLAFAKRLPANRKKQLNAIGFNWDKGNFSEDRWQEMYAKLKAFKAKHGHCRVLKSHDFTLSVWVQRNKRDKNIIGKNKRDKLEQLGILWPHEYLNNNWEAMYNTLREFKKKHGHVNVPPTELKLYRWIQDQRKLKLSHLLKKDRENKLTKLDFIWSGEADRKMIQVWDSYYRRFKTLNDRYGSNYHEKLKEDDDLNAWVDRQLQSKNKLSDYKRDKLNAINFQWNRTGLLFTIRWEKMYEQLVTFKKKNGHCDVSQTDPNRSLASWVNRQRTIELPEVRKTKLTKIGFSWVNEVLENRWLQRVEEFKALKKKNKNQNIKPLTPLYSWVYQQKKNFKKLSPERKKILLKEGIVSL